MRQAFGRVALLVVVTGLCACAGPRAPAMASTTLSRVAEVPRKVFMLAHLDQSLPDAFEEGCVAALQKEFENLGATVSTVKLSGLELDRRAHENVRAEFQPDMVLIVAFNSRSTSGSTLRGVVRMHLLDARDTEVWRSQQGFALTFLPIGSTGGFETGARAGNAAFQQLVADRVFPGPV